MANKGKNKRKRHITTIAIKPETKEQLDHLLTQTNTRSMADLVDILLKSYELSEIIKKRNLTCIPKEEFLMLCERDPQLVGEIFRETFFLLGGQIVYFVLLEGYKELQYLGLIEFKIRQESDSEFTLTFSNSIFPRRLWINFFVPELIEKVAQQLELKVIIKGKTAQFKGAITMDAPFS